MACERYRDALSDLAAGGPAVSGLEVHVAACEACRTEVEGLRQALALADGELARLLSALPSPELPARIRAAASEAAAAPTWRPGLWLAFAGAAAALVVAAFLLAQRVGQSEPTTPIAGATAPAASPAAPLAPAAAAALPRATPAIRRARALAAASSPSPGRSGAPAAEPEVLVPAGEAEALHRFAASLRQRSVAPQSLLVADLNAPLAESGDLAIRPIELVPLDPEEDSGAE